MRNAGHCCRPVPAMAPRTPGRQALQMQVSTGRKGKPSVGCRSCDGALARALMRFRRRALHSWQPLQQRQRYFSSTPGRGWHCTTHYKYSASLWRQ